MVEVALLASYFRSGMVEELTEADLEEMLKPSYTAAEVVRVLVNESSENAFLYEWLSEADRRVCESFGHEAFSVGNVC